MPTLEEAALGAQDEVRKHSPGFRREGGDGYDAIRELMRDPSPSRALTPDEMRAEEARVDKAAEQQAQYPTFPFNGRTVEELSLDELRAYERHIEQARLTGVRARADEQLARTVAATGGKHPRDMTPEEFKKYERDYQRALFSRNGGR